MYRDPFEKFVLMPVRRQPVPAPSIVPRERVQPPPKVEAKKPDPVTRYVLAACSGWPAQPTSIRSLVDVVVKVSGLPVSDVLGKRHVYAKARHIVAWLARRFTTCSLPLIAKQIRRKDHSAILYGIARVDLAIREAPICAPSSDTAEAWTTALWNAKWPALDNRDPLKIRNGP